MTPTHAHPDGPSKALDAERHETLTRLAALREDLEAFHEASRDSNADDEHDPEGHTIAYERSQTQALARQAQEHLARIEAARERVTDGSYGRCASCGATIPTARLVARPTAELCVACASG